jgi:hypothetical protein
MSTTYLQPEADDDPARTLRIPPIAADLLPPEVVAARRGRAVRRVVLSALGGFTVILIAWSAVAMYETSSARDSLDQAQSDAARLTNQQKQYAPLIKAQTESQQITAQLGSLFADDLQWPALLQGVRQAAPAGVQVTAISGGRDDAANGTRTTAKLPNTTGQRVIGRLTISATGPNGRALAAYVEGLGTVKGLANPMLTSVSSDGGSLLLTVQVDITEAAVGGRHTTSDGAKGN